MTRPPSTMPPPMPVPRLTMTRWLSPRPAPKRCSAHTAALASLSTKIGRRHPLAERLAQRLVAPREVRREDDGGPVGRDEAGGPDADRGDVVGAPASSSSTTETMVSSTTRGLVDRCGVSRRARASTVPSASTTPPATLVPPMSMPMASGPSATGCLLRVVGVTDRDRAGSARGSPGEAGRPGAAGGGAAAGPPSAAVARGVGARSDAGGPPAGRLPARSVSTVAARPRGRRAWPGSRG